MEIDTEALKTRLGQALGWQRVALQALTGATSASLFIADNGEERAVVRIFDPERWEENPADLSDRESTILQTLRDSNLAAPGLLATLPENGVVMTWLPGDVNLPQQPEPDWLMELAATLTSIHASNLSVPYRYESWTSFDPDSAPAWWPDEGLWHQATAIHAELVSAPTQFIHRDYHPLNLLWEGSRVCGVVDWINACMGPVQVDVSHCRLNLALMYGMSAADTFLAAYQQQNPGWEYQAYWDLDAAFGATPKPEPYPPWATFGLTGLTTELMRERLVAMVHSVVNRHDSDGENR